MTACPGYRLNDRGLLGMCIRTKQDKQARGTAPAVKRDSGLWDCAEFVAVVARGKA